MNFDNKKIMPRFFVVIVLMSLGGLCILGHAAYLMFAKKDYWTQVSRKLVRENVPIPAKRGNILSADGQIMASSLPEYKIYMDYVAYDKDPEVKQELIREGYDPKNGARPLRRVMEDKLEAMIAEHLLAGEVQAGDMIEISRPKGKKALQFKVVQE